MKCLIWESRSNLLFVKKILNKYKVKYFRCSVCGLIQAEKPYWLSEAYSSPIIDFDTGVISRNIKLSRITALISLFLLGRKVRVNAKRYWGGCLLD